MNYRTIFYNLGNILILAGAFMYLPVIVALIYGEQEGRAYAIAGVVSAAAGLLMKAPGRNPQRLRAREGFVIVALSWIAISIVGTAAFCLSGEFANVADAFFESVSGITTTGATVQSDVGELSHATLFWRSLSNWLGGMGILVFMLAILPLHSGNTLHLLRAESAGPAVSKIMPRMQASAFALYFAYIALTLSEIVFLASGGMPIFDSINYAMTTAGTGGFGVTNAGLALYESEYIRIVVTIFMILFGMNFNVYFLLLLGKPREVLKKSEVRVYIAMIIAATVTVAAAVGTLYSDTKETIVNSLFTICSMMTSTGFTITDYTQWPLYPKAVIVILMTIGACAGSTCGGIKISRVVLLLKAARENLRRLVSPRSVKPLMIDGKVVEKSTMADVNAFITIYVLIATVSFLLISLDANADAATSASAVLAALNNTGTGFGAIGSGGCWTGFSAFSQVVLCFDMIAGRLEIFPLVILLMPKTWKKS